jgi:hypothetical protein
VSDDARPENADSQREVDALSGLPEDSRVHLDDIEWPELDWSDSDELPAPPPATPALRPGQPSVTTASTPTSASGPQSGPKFNGKDGTDWRPPVPFWLRMPDPEPSEDPEPGTRPTDWRPAVPFWLRTPEPGSAEPASVPVTEAGAPEAEPSAQAVDEPVPAEPEPEPSRSAEPDLEPSLSVEPNPDDPPVEPAQPAPPAEPARPELVEELPPEEDLIPLPGTTGDAVFFPPSGNRAFAIRAASAQSPAAAPSPAVADSPTSAPSPVRPDDPAPAEGLAGPDDDPAPAAETGTIRTSRSSARSSAAPFSLPSAPYAQYDAPGPGWESTAPGPAWAVDDGRAATEERTPSSRTAKPTPAPRRRWLLRGALIGSVISALVVTLIIVLATQGRFNTINGTITGGPQGSPEEVVSGYLNALAHNDSQQALGFAKLRPSDQRLLTDEVLAASNSQAQLRQLTVRTTDLTDYRAQVEATYLLGQQRTTQSFTVYAVGSEWKLYDVARRVDLTQLNTSDLPLTINGVSVSPDSVELFPGHYQVATSDDRYHFTGDTFIVKSPSAIPELGVVQLELSSGGVAEVAAAAKSQLKRCLATHELQPVGCGFGAVAPKGTTVQVDTTRWKATKGLDSLAMMRPTLEPDDPRLASAEVLIQVTGTAKDTKGANLGVVDSIRSVQAKIGPNGIDVTLD